MDTYNPAREFAVVSALKLGADRGWNADDLVTAAAKIEAFLTGNDQPAPETDGESPVDSGPAEDRVYKYGRAPVADHAHLARLVEGVATGRDHSVEIAGVLITPCDEHGRRL